MSRISITGKGTLRYTPSGKPVLEVNQNIAPRRKNRDSGQWEQQGEDLWVKGALWKEEAERIAALCPDGWRVSLEGDLVLREYEGRDGSPRTSVELFFPRFVGYVPPRDAQPQQQPPTFQQGSYQQPADDPWATTGGAQTFDEVAPF